MPAPRTRYEVRCGRDRDSSTPFRAPVSVCGAGCAGRSRGGVRERKSDSGRLGVARLCHVRCRLTESQSASCTADAPRRAPRRRVRKQTLWSQSPPTRRWSLVGGADEHLAARDPAASVSRLVTAQCALDCSLIQWCFGRRARARRDERLNRSTASDRTAPHRTAPAVPRWR